LQVTHLIMGPDVHGTTKHQKAEEAGVTILTEDEFSEMLEVRRM
jgi:NAD-dependent DNA ligase